MNGEQFLLIINSIAIYFWFSAYRNIDCTYSVWEFFAYKGYVPRLDPVHTFTVRMDEGRLRKVRRGEPVAERFFYFFSM